jgi:hypothetical protein
MKEDLIVSDSYGDEIEISYEEAEGLLFYIPSGGGVYVTEESAIKIRDYMNDFLAKLQKKDNKV